MASRRDILKGLGAAGVLSGFVAGAPRWLVPPAHAMELDPDRYFIFCYFNGGWDLLLCLDPRDPAVFSPDLKKVTRIETGYEALPSGRRELVPTSVPGMTFGPYIGRLAEHAQRLTVVRGISMDTLTHEVGRRRFITGLPPAGLQAQGSSLMTVLASYLGANDPIPQLSVQVESYNDRFESYATAIKVNAVEDLVRALRVPSDGLSAGEQAALDEFLEAERACDRALTSSYHRLAHASRQASADLVSLGLDSQFDFDAEQPEMEALRERYGFERGDLKSAGAQAAAAVTAITAGISRCVSVTVAENLDSHGPEWATAHGPRLEGGFDVIAAMIEDLQSRQFRDTSESWLDHTTIIAFSEFGRTTLLNSSGGRDHFLHNATVLCGGGIPGGRVLGASSDVGMAPTGIDLVSGASTPGGTILNPEHLFRAILHDVGIEEDVADYRKDPLVALTG